MRDMWTFLFFIFITQVQGVIYPYNHEELRVGHLEYRRIGMYASSDPRMEEYAGEPARVNVEVYMERSSVKADGLLQVLFAHVDSFGAFGAVDDNGEKRFCCTEDLSGRVRGCEESLLGTAIISETTVPVIQTHDVPWLKNESAVFVNYTFIVEKTGRYYFMLSSCLASTGDVTMTGTISWINPFGYLPGELFPLVSLYQYLSLGYLFLGIVWFFLCVMYRQELLRLQYYVFAVIDLGFLEYTAWYFDYVNFNETGSRSMTSTTFAVLLSSTKRSFSRVLVLVVCMGYGILTPTLTVGQYRKVLGLGIVYFAFSSVHDILISYSQVTFVVQEIRVFFLFPLAALDSIFFLWILQEISVNIEYLTVNQQVAKLSIFKNFWLILVLTAIFSVCWASFQIYSSVWMNEDDYWQYIWVFDGIWHIIYFFVLLTIAFLWRPSSQTKAYALSEQLTTKDEDEDDVDNADPDGIRSMTQPISPAFSGADDSD
eukprot:c19243_g1_i1.p1 GENE.c19243_g1_i1~~c19243_g1_i1.p1  ORF type:complete len:485 (-),score=140.09 c19243_g1_i1:114-1568(-)